MRPRSMRHLAADLREPIREIAQRNSRDWSLVAAMFDPELEIYAYRRAGTNAAVYLSTEEFAEKYDRVPAVADEGAAENTEKADAVQWVQGPAVTQPGQVLELTGRQAAEQFHLARYMAEDFRQLQQLYQLERTPELIGPNWAFELIDALASPQLASVLLFIGAFALIAELSSPGIGVGGFLSAICFLLYFWSNFLHGTAELLEVLLFLAGLTCLLVELFVLPGFGVFGVGGGALVVVSLILASQTFVLPSNEYQLHQMPRSLLTVTAAGAGVLPGLYVLRKYLHRAPVLGNVVLLPPDEDEAENLSRRESLVDYEHLLGHVGVTRTQLTPSGKAVFEDELVDVISDGLIIPKGSSVRVVEVLGNRVLVEPLDEVS